VARDNWADDNNYDPQEQILLLMGDLVEGKARKSQGTGLYLSTMGEQVQAAIDLFTGVSENFNRVFRVEGTPYHEDFDKDMQWFDSAIGCESGHFLPLEINKTILTVAHHPPGGSVLYQGTKLNSTMRNMLAAAAAGKMVKADVSIRAHLHEYASLELDGCLAVQTPCWKLADPYAIKQNAERFQPSLGWLELNYDPEAMSRWRPTPRLFRGLEESAVGRVRKVD
jgi:hypothetical protein